MSIFDSFQKLTLPVHLIFIIFIMLYLAKKKFFVFMFGNSPQLRDHFHLFIRTNKKLLSAMLNYQAVLQGYFPTREYKVPKGLYELCSDICREIIRSQPANIYDFIAEYTDELLNSREIKKDSVLRDSKIIAQIFCQLQPDLKPFSLQDIIHPCEISASDDAAVDAARYSHDVEVQGFCDATQCQNKIKKEKTGTTTGVERESLQ